MPPEIRCGLLTHAEPVKTGLFRLKLIKRFPDIGSQAHLILL